MLLEYLERTSDVVGVPKEVMLLEYLERTSDVVGVPRENQ